jgi:DNA-binding NtrC family response regulator
MIFVVEDEAPLRRSLVEYLNAAGHPAEGFGDAEGALEAAKTAAPDLAVCDLQLPGMSGLQLMEELAGLDPGIVRIAMTAGSSVQSALRAMRGGCYEYLEKPLDLEKLARLVTRALSERRSARELSWVRSAGAGRQVGGELQGESAALEGVRRQVEALSKLGADAPPVLIAGETGVGKGLVARVLHRARFGEDAPWIEVNCAALPAALVEAELFGFERSAFTDAKQAKPGLFEAAEGGTLFLDEVGELGLEVQAKLLKVVEARVIRRLGAVRERPVSAAVVAASNVDLPAAVAAGKFRADLYHRLAALTVTVPPLRERGDDCLILARSALASAASRYQKPLRGLSPAAEARVLRLRWPGNIRELLFAIERAVILSPAEATTLEADLLPALEGPPAPRAAPGSPSSAGLEVSAAGIRVDLPPEGVPFEELEKAIFIAALQRTSGNVVQAAKLLHMNRDAVRYRVKKFGLTAYMSADKPGG